MLHVAPMTMTTTMAWSVVRKFTVAVTLSGAANITSQIGRNGVVPLRQYLIGFKSKR